MSIDTRSEGDVAMTAATRRARVWVGPEQPDVIVEAVVRAGGVVSDPASANVIVWSSLDHEVGAIRDKLTDSVEWVQVDSAGVDHWINSGLVDGKRIWSSARGRYGATVAEHAIALLLAGSRGFVRQARARHWEPVETVPLRGRSIGFLGGGSIVRHAIERLAGFDVQCLVMSEPPDPIPGAHTTVGPAGLEGLLEMSDDVVVALPLTSQTAGLIGRRELDLVGSEGLLVNVGRGAVVDTVALVSALEVGSLGGAMLDVTDPEPLPMGHPLWHMDNVLISSHSANSLETMNNEYAGLVEDNVERFRRGIEPRGVINRQKGY